MGSQNQNLTFRPFFPRRLPFWCPILMGLGKFLPKNLFNIRHDHLQTAFSCHHCPVKAVQLMGMLGSGSGISNVGKICAYTLQNCALHMCKTAHVQWLHMDCQLWPTEDIITRDR